MYLNEFTDSFKRFLKCQDTFCSFREDGQRTTDGTALVSGRLAMKVPIDESGRYHSLLLGSELFAPETDDMDVVYRLGNHLKSAGILDKREGVIYDTSFELRMDRALCAARNIKEHEEHDLASISKVARDDIVALMAEEEMGKLPGRRTPDLAHVQPEDKLDRASRFESKANLLINVKGLDESAALKSILASEIETIVGYGIGWDLQNSPSLILRYIDDPEMVAASLARTLRETILPKQLQDIPDLAAEIDYAIERVTLGLTPEWRTVNEIMRAFRDLPRSRALRPSSRVTLTLKRGDGEGVPVKVPYQELEKMLQDGDVSNIGIWITYRERMELKDCFGSDCSWVDVRICDIASVSFRGKPIFEGGVGGHEVDKVEVAQDRCTDHVNQGYDIEDVMAAASEQAEMSPEPSMDPPRGDAERGL